MTVQLDNFDVAGKKRLIIVAVVVGAVLSHITCLFRVMAKMISVGRLYSEDWFMLAALLMSYGIIFAEIYGMAHGLGSHEDSVSKPNLRQVNLSIWILQRFQPPSIFCIKTSIILLYVRIFNTPIFKRVAWGAWIYTLLWTIGAWTSSTFECTPIDFFWNKKIKGGHCVKNALTVIGFTNGFLSFLGDLFILAMPLPLIWKLNMNRRSKIALTSIFMFGGFVVGTSIIRFIALFGINEKDLTFTQVEPGVWTYLEISIGITCGNLPLLRPLFRRFFDNVRSTASNSQSKQSKQSKLPVGSRYVRSRNAPGSSRYTSDGFERMGNELDSLGGSGSEIELQDRRYKGGGIKVDTEVKLSVAEVLPDRHMTLAERGYTDPLKPTIGTNVRIEGKLERV